MAATQVDEGGDPPETSYTIWLCDCFEIILISGDTHFSTQVT